MNSIYQRKNKNTLKANPETVKTIKTRMMKKVHLIQLNRIKTQVRTRFL